MGDAPRSKASPENLELSDEGAPLTVPSTEVRVQCPGCGQIVGTGGGNCPNCGTFVPSERRESRHVMPRPVATEPPPPLPALPMKAIAIGAGLGTIAVAAFVLFGGSSGTDDKEPKGAASGSPAVAQTPPSTGDGAPLPGLTNTEVDQAWDEAAKRAEAWKANALLFDVRISPVARGKVLLEQGGDITFRYGQARSGGFASGTVLGSGMLTVTVTVKGTTQHAGSAEAGRLSVTEPNCPFTEILNQARAAGFGEAPVAVRYSYSKKFSKAVWTVEAADKKLTATFDGSTCTVLVR